MRSRTQYYLTLGAAALACGLVYSINPTEHTLIPCVFHKLTGFECAGCGMTRATHFLFHGDVHQVLHYNPLAFIVLPALVYALVARGLELHGRRRFPRLQDYPFLNIGSAVFLVVFMLLRNIVQH